MRKSPILFRKEVLSWAGYDFANTIFSMNIVSRYFPLLVLAALGGTDLAIGIARSAAMILVAVTMPIFGALADQLENRKLPLIIFTLACCILTALLNQFGILTIELMFFGMAVYCYQSALVFYNALLPSVSPPGKLGYVSGLGVALGYLGSITGLFSVALLSAKILSPYLWTAILFLIFSLPAFIWVKDKKISEKASKQNPDRYKKGLIASLKRAAAIPGLIRFLVGRFFVVEAMETVILFMAVYLVRAAGFSDNKPNNLGIDETTFFLIVVTASTIIGSYFWGIFTQKYSPKKMLLGAVALWLFALIGIVFLTDRSLLFIWGSLAGIGLGGVWTSDRPLLINLIADPAKLGEYFGLYALSGRLAAVIGPVIWGLVTYFGEPLGIIRYKIAVGALFIMMIVGFVILRKIPDAR
jgi:UMF1 family MFS transporter